jgi:hypothetical protein
MTAWPPTATQRSSSADAERASEVLRVIPSVKLGPQSVDETVGLVAGEADGVAEQPIARLGTVDLAQPWRAQ